MQFGAAGSTVHRPVETVKCELGARGGGGCIGGGGGGVGFEHTRQPVETVEVSEVHVMLPLPNVKAEGPFASASPLKGTSVPAALYILRKS